MKPSDIHNAHLEMIKSTKIKAAIYDAIIRSFENSEVPDIAQIVTSMKMSFDAMSEANVKAQLEN